MKWRMQTQITTRPKRLWIAIVVLCIACLTQRQGFKCGLRSAEGGDHLLHPLLPIHLSRIRSSKKPQIMPTKCGQSPSCWKVWVLLSVSETTKNSNVSNYVAHATFCSAKKTDYVTLPGACTHHTLNFVPHSRVQKELWPFTAPYSEESMNMAWDAKRVYQLQ
jgi:hypothetical protein